MTSELAVPCPVCGFTNTFPQPYRYHAGFGDTAFLYNEAGNRTLVWGVYDAAYERLLRGDDAWRPSPARQCELEQMLPSSPVGDRWLFSAPGRCHNCRQPIAAPMASGEIYYLEYAGSVILGRAGLPNHLDALLAPRASA